MTKEKYRSILKLKEYCDELGIECKLSTMFDGYRIDFRNGDVIQHEYSYGADEGCVEFAIGCKADYTAVTLKNAKAIIKRHKEKMIKENANETT